MSRQEQATGEETARWHDFGAWLAQTCVDLGYTQAHVACQADISTQSLVSLEHGGFRCYADGPWILPNPRDDTLVSLARLYGVKAEEMFKRVGRYADRPQTKTSLHRRGRASSRQPARGDRIAELEAKFEGIELARGGCQRTSRVAAELAGGYGERLVCFSVLRAGRRAAARRSPHPARRHPGRPHRAAPPPAQSRCVPGPSARRCSPNR
jgi:transcriptional regulator with XRE-family HTH domain